MSERKIKVKAGIQYIEGLSIKDVVESGFEYIELCMNELDKLDIIKAQGGRIAGINVRLMTMLASRASDKEILDENAVKIFGKVITYAKDGICAYIVINTEGVNNTAVLEQLVSESEEFLKNSDKSIYIENGYKYEYGRYYHNEYSDGRKLVSLIGRLGILCPWVEWKIGLSVGHTNLLGINLKDMVRVCGKLIGVVHRNRADDNFR